MGSFAKSGILCNINPTCPTSQYEHSIGTRRSKLLAEVKQFPRSMWNGSRSKREDTNQKRGYRSIVKALPDLNLMAVLVQHVEGQRDWISHKTIWHLNDEAIKNVYTMYIMFTCWGCCFFGSMKDPYYDSEEYRGDGGDGTGHWVYEKQEDIEESNRAKLWREELLEEIEQKVGGLQELEEAGKEEELVK